MTPEQQIERLTTWLNTYPPLPDDVSGDPELMVVQTVRRLLFTDEPIEVATSATDVVREQAASPRPGATPMTDLTPDPRAPGRDDKEKQ